jgi:hypothetical protein
MHLKAKSRAQNKGSRRFKSPSPHQTVVKARWGQARTLPVLVPLTESALNEPETHRPRPDLFQSRTMNPRSTTTTPLLRLRLTGPACPPVHLPQLPAAPAGNPRRDQRWSNSAGVGDEGLIISELREGKKVYGLTEQRKRELAEKDEAVRHIWRRTRRWEDWRSTFCRR